MLRLVVLAGLLTAAWLAREANWPPLNRVLPPPTPHENYWQAMQASGAAGTPLGQAWREAARLAMSAPTPVITPAQRTIEFDSTLPQAWAFRVSLRRGQRVEVDTHIRAAAPAQTFVDIFEVPAGEGARPNVDWKEDFDHERGALRAAAFEPAGDRDVIVRVQPELLRGGTLELRIVAAPALRFPVADARLRDLQSVFGDPRDAGRRQHEGVDIFATRGTPVLSATNGVVMRVGETALGGRVVWVGDTSRGLRVYYAHLDAQLVSTGQRVKVGDVIGTVGNTGNARTTAPHLHFGIYERGRGAIDPYWFIAPAGLPRRTETARREGGPVVQNGTDE